MTDHYPHPQLVDADDGDASLTPYAQLDPCRAWRADLAKVEAEGPLSEARAERWLLWLQIVTVFDRLRMLPVADRAAYARSTAGLWEMAERVTGLERFRRVGEVMAAWEGEAPELAGFKELLWAVEQAEADGASWASYKSLKSLSRSVNTPDIRGAYAIAQSGRVLRTVGRMREALSAFDLAAKSARRHKDGWLLARVKLGAGVVYHTRGNFPAARKEFTAALRYASPYSDLLIGAHLGIVSACCTPDKFDFACKHAQAALSLAQGDAHSEVEALSLLVELHVQARKYKKAREYCQLALDKNPRAHKRPCLIRNMVYASLHLRDEAAVRAYFGPLRMSVSDTPNPWEHASCEYMLGVVHRSWAENVEAELHFTRSLAIADRFGLHEIRWRAERALSGDQIGGLELLEEAPVLSSGNEMWPRREETAEVEDPAVLATSV